MMYMPIMNAYVGIANAVPDSRMPRRFSRGQYQDRDDGEQHLVLR